MAKSKTYDPAIVENEFNKLTLKEQLEVYNNLGVWLHDKVVKHQEGLGAELNHFEAAKKSLKTGTTSK